MPRLASTPVRVVGSDSVAATGKVVDDWGAGVAALSGAQLAPLYADAVVYDDFVFGLHLEGRARVLKELRRSLGEASGARVIASYADSGWGVIEHRWDFSDSYGVSIQPVTVLEIRDQQIVGEAWYYEDPANLPDGRPPEPVPLKSPPGSADTPAAAEAVALRYAAALQAKDAAAVGALSAPGVAFMDTASSTTGASPGEVQAHYASMFAAPADLAFTQLRYAFGRGWAAVMWTASAQSSGVGGGGVTMLELRGGKVARETLYYNSSNMPY
jgi:ketosteroid isomerase-like protein